MNKYSIRIAQPKDVGDLIRMAKKLVTYGHPSNTFLINKRGKLGFSSYYTFVGNNNSLYISFIIDMNTPPSLCHPSLLLKKVKR